MGLDNTNNNKIIYYYQTFSSLTPLIEEELNNVYVYVSSLHFGKDIRGSYLNLNNTSPDSQVDVLEDLEKASIAGITILVMLGGAGGAYGALFSDFNYYYVLLYNFLKKYPFIQGIDLDVEEVTSIEDIEKLVNQLDKDFGTDFIITMAPIESAMSSDSPGLGSFSYKELYHSSVGNRINWFNVQCYNLFTEDVYSSIIENGYPVEKITFGMLGDNVNPNNFPAAVEEIKTTISKYPNMNGVCLWEYGDTRIDPLVWGKTINRIFKGCDLDSTAYSCNIM